MKKNIIFLSVDQFSYDLLNKSADEVNIPNIKRLIKQGMSFENSYCTDPVCCPSRSSWATGLFSSENGVPFNKGELHDSITDIGEYLSSNGYKTFHSGKWHVVGRDLKRGFNVLYDGKRKIDAGGADIYDDYITMSAIDFLNSYQIDDPFYLQVNYINPHDICEYLHSFEDKSKEIKNPVQLGLIDEDSLPLLPKNFEYDKSEIITQIVGRRLDDCLIHNKILNAIKDWNELEWRSYIWYYYRLVEKVDLEIGKFIEALRHSRFANNTIIIFTADHGESCASHKMFQKFTLYEESVRVPLCISTFSDEFQFPKNILNCDNYVSGIDIFKTICDIAEIDYPKNIHGESLLPIIEGNQTDINQYVYIESNYFSRAIVYKKLKYIMEYKPNNGSLKPVNQINNEIGREQIFDLENDPYETINIAVENKDYIEMFRKLLFQHEKTLNQKEVQNKQGKDVIKNWSSRILDYYEQLELK